MQKIFLIIVSSLIFNISSLAKTPQSYVQKYKKWAIKEMKLTGIPASITLAQGILESDCGTSYLAVAGKNHFGIKCNNRWRGKAVYKNDDSPNECFRKYKSVYDSYKDHSRFLMTNRRYAFLFRYKTTDYRAWAIGLRRAGYATAKDYSKKLIKIIEKERLYRYDEVIKKPQINQLLTLSKDVKSPKKLNIKHKIDFEKKIDFPRNILKKNGVKCVRTKKGDTLFSLSKELNLSIKNIQKYNDLMSQQKILPNVNIYLEKKQKKYYGHKNHHFANGTESLHQISQIYAVRLNKLKKYNKKTPKYKKLKPGKKIRLR